LTSEVVALKKLPATEDESTNYQEINTVPGIEFDRIGVKEVYKKFHRISEPDIDQFSRSLYQEVNTEEQEITEHVTMKNRNEISICDTYLLPTTSRSNHTYIDIIESSPEIRETWIGTSDDSETVSAADKYDDTICATQKRCTSSENLYLHPI
jgi:hypothetical protein